MRNRQNATFILIAFLMLVLQGCAAFTHYNYKRPIPANTGSAVFADAKQRAVLSAPRPSERAEILRDIRLEAISEITNIEEQLEKNINNERRDYLNAVRKEKIYLRDSVTTLLINGDYREDSPRLIAFCAEPSPDALSALTASGGFNLNTQRLNAQTKGALAEAAGSMGLRTQSIQLMRDAMFRLCEGNMNGALGNAAFETLHRRFQNSMVAILAIEQITGVVRPPAVYLEGGSTIGAADDLLELTDRLEKAREKVTEAEKTLKDAEDAKKKANDAVSAKSKDITELDQKIKEDEGKHEASKKGADGKPTPEASWAPPLSAINADKEKLETLNGELEELKKTEAEKQAAVEKAQTSLKSRQETQERLDKVVENAQNGRASALSIAGGETVQNKHTVNAETAKQIAIAVETITTKFYETSFMDEVCTTVITSMTDGEADSNALNNELVRAVSVNVDKEDKTISIVGTCAEHLIRTSEQIKRANQKELKLMEREIEINKQSLESYESYYQQLIDIAHERAKLSSQKSKTLQSEIDDLTSKIKNGEISAQSITDKIKALEKKQNTFKKNVNVFCALYRSIGTGLSTVIAQDNKNAFDQLCVA